MAMASNGANAMHRPGAETEPQAAPGAGPEWTTAGAHGAGSRTQEGSNVGFIVVPYPDTTGYDHAAHRHSQQFR